MAGKKKNKSSSASQQKTTQRSRPRNGRRSDGAELRVANDLQNIPANPVVRRTRNNETANVSDNIRPSRITTARFREDNAMVYISAEGQDTEFNEGASQTDSMESEGEIDLGANNNATLTDRRGTTNPLEDGECDDVEPGPSAKRPRSETTGATAMGEDLRSYVDQKFNALAKMVELERELSDKNRELDLLRAKGNKQQHPEQVHSEITVYKNAVEQSKRGSLSSEDFIDTSNEADQLIQNDGPPTPDHELDNMDNRSWRYEPNNEDYFISEREIEKARDIQRGRNDERNRDRNRDRRGSQSYDQDSQPRDRSDYRVETYVPPRRDPVEEKARRLVNEAEAAKARIYEVPGNCFNDNVLERNDYAAQLRNFCNLMSTAQMDEEYKMVAAHVDHKLRTQILNHEFIDFSRLLPKSRAGIIDEEPVMQIVNRGGCTCICCCFG